MYTMNCDFVSGISQKNCENLFQPAHIATHSEKLLFLPNLKSRDKHVFIYAENFRGCFAKLSTVNANSRHSDGEAEG